MTNPLKTQGKALILFVDLLLGCGRSGCEHTTLTLTRRTQGSGHYLHINI